MLFKTLTVEALQTSRDKKSLGEVIDQSVKEFLKNENAELERMEVHGADLNSKFGKALVTVYYKPSNTLSPAVPSDQPDKAPEGSQN